MSNVHLEFYYYGWTSSRVPGKTVVWLPLLPKNVATTVEIINNKSFELGRALEWHHYLLEYIFGYLNMEDLQMASFVNPLWNNLAKREFDRRISPAWIKFYYKPLPNRLLYLNTSLSFTYSNTQIALIVYSPDMIRLEQRVWLNKASGSKRLPSFAEYIGKEIVPAGVPHCTIPCLKVSPSGDGITDVVIFCGIFIPFIPQIRTEMFYCDPEQSKLPKFKNGNEQVKCLLMFTQKRLKLPDNFLLSLLNSQNPETVAVGGGLVNTRKTSMQKNNCEHYQKPNDLLCITFLQDEGVEANFNAYSVVVKYIMYSSTCETLEAELMKLKKTAVLRKHGIIFNFCLYLSFGRQGTAAIEKHFPRYPLVGFGLDLDEVIGWNSTNTDEFDDKPENSSELRVTDLPKNVHDVSLVLVLITWGKRCSTFSV